VVEAGPQQLWCNRSNFGGATDLMQYAATGGPPPPPPPPGGVVVKKKKLKVLHWKKVPNNKIAKSIWDGLQAPPQALVDRHKLELVFYDEPKVSAKAPKSDGAAGGVAAKVSLLDLRRAQTVGIMLSRFKLPLDAVARAIRRMDARALTLDDVVAVRSYLPTDEEVTMIEGFKGEASTLAPPDLHFWHLMRIPLLQRRLDAFAYLLSFDSRVRALRASIKNIQVACAEVLGSNHLRFVLATVLGVGNTLNEGTFAGNARGFKVETLLRLGDVKSTDGKTDLMKYLASRFYNEFPEPFALPSSLAHASDAAKENFLELDREIGLVMEGMDSIADLVLDAEQDCVLTGVLEAFRARTAEQPAALLASMDVAKLEFDKVTFSVAVAVWVCVSVHLCVSVSLCLCNLILEIVIINQGNLDDWRWVKQRWLIQQWLMQQLSNA